MKLTKTTTNYAERRNLGLEVVSGEEVGSTGERLWVWGENSDCEPLITYYVNDDGFTFEGSIALPEEIKEELPHWIKGEAHLREVVDFVAKQLSA